MKTSIHPVETERLVLRPPAQDDYEVWREGHLAMSSPQTVFDKTPRSEEKLTNDDWQALLSHLNKQNSLDRGYVLFGFRKSDGKWVSTISVFDILRGTQQTGWLGYHVLNPYWQNGYGVESVRAMLHVAFAQLELHRLEALTELENHGSQALARKAGLREEGMAKKRVFQRGEWKDAKVYAITAEEL